MTMNYIQETLFYHIHELNMLNLEIELSLWIEIGNKKTLKII